MNYLKFAEYLWLDGAGPSSQIRSKTRVLQLSDSPKLSDFPVWHLDGSRSTQVHDGFADAILKPVKIYQDPLSEQEQFLVWCELNDSGNNAHASNRRSMLRSTEKLIGEDLEPWVSLKQEFSVGAQGSERENPTMAGAHAHWSVRKLMALHAQACLDADLPLVSSSLNETNCLSEFELGYRGIAGDACNPLAIADDFWLARHLLKRIAEQYGWQILFSAAATGNNGSDSSVMQESCVEVKFSTSYTRDPRCGETALKALLDAMRGVKQCESGKPEAPTPIQAASSSTRGVYVQGVVGEDRDAKVHVPYHISQRGHGYIVDRCAKGDIDPYEICINLLKAVTQDESACNFL